MTFDAVEVALSAINRLKISRYIDPFYPKQLHKNSWSHRNKQNYQVSQLTSINPLQDRLTSLNLFQHAVRTKNNTKKKKNKTKNKKQTKNKINN